MESFHIRRSNRYLWSFEAGMRASYWSWNQEWNMSPRGQIMYKPLGKGGNQTFRLAAGLYVQPPFYREYRYMDGTLNPDIKSRSEEHTSELQSRGHLVCRLLLE